MPIFLTLILLVTGAFGFRYYLKRQTRTKLLTAPLSHHQRVIIAGQVPLIQKLPFELHRKLEGKINVFLHQIEFVGCNGLDVTEEMQLSIAAQACLLVVNRDTWYKHLQTILIYPDAFKSRGKNRDGYVVTERETVRTGESWSRGPVVLSWAHSKQGAMNDTDGHNVVLHEFAHQIDDLSGHTNGAPVLTRGHSLFDWERVFVNAFERHVQNIERGRKTVIDAYGAEGPEEFFAVSVEVFFEKPAALKRAEPKIYDQLSEFFRLDPMNWQ
ncbi:MAG: hypothetical protein COB39_04810 [Marinosulfonomonas sp.]|nr:MAG: hypothetical protein COB39_04810 [Marinosulfonomonas sp.]